MGIPQTAYFLVRARGRAPAGRSKRDDGQFEEHTFAGYFGQEPQQSGKRGGEAFHISWRGRPACMLKSQQQVLKNQHTPLSVKAEPEITSVGHEMRVSTQPLKRYDH